MARHPARGHRRDRRLQGARARAPGHEGRPRRARRADGDEPSASSARRRSRRSPARPCWSEFERDPARGAFPDQAPPEHDPLSHLELVRNADAFLVAPASANTIAKLAARPRRQPAHQRRARRRLPGPRRAGDERPDVGAPGDAGQPRRRCARAASTVLDPGTGALGSKGEWGTGPPAPSRPSCSPPSRRSCPPARRARSTGCGCSSPRAGRASRSTACATSATARSGRMGFALADEAARRGAAVTCVAANVSLARDPASRYVDVETAAELAAACEERFADVRPAADGRGAWPTTGPADARETKIKKDGASASSSSSSAPTTSSPRWPRAAAPGQTLVGFAAEHGEGRSPTARGKLRAQGPGRRRASTTSRAPTSASTPTTTRSRSSPRTARRTIPRAGQGRGRAAPSSTIVRGSLIRRGAQRAAMEPLEPLDRVAAGELDARPPASRAHRRERRARRRGRATRSLDDLLVALAAEGHVLDRGLPGRRQDGARPLAGPLDRPGSSRACSARPTCCPPTSSAPASTTSASSASSSGPARSSPTSCSSTRSTARRPRPSRACWSACRSATSPSTCTRTSWPGRSSSWPRRTRSSTRAPTRCPRRRSTASWSALSLGYPTAGAEAAMLAGHETGDRVARARAGGHADRASLGAPGRRRPRARLRGAARLRRRAARPHARRPARRARREPARRA